MKKILMFLLLVPTFVFSQNKDELISKINHLLDNDFFKSTSAAINIYNLTKDESLYQLNSKLLLHPASNMKILTTTAALVFLGPDYEFTTSLYYTGNIVNGILYGDLYAVGGCDPDFTSKDLDSMTAEFKKLGVKEIFGNIYGDVSMIDTLFWGNGWMWDDDPSTDEMYLSALNINDNAIEVKVNVENNNPKVTLNPQSNFTEVEFNSFVGDQENNSALIIDRDWLNRKNTILIKRNLKKDLPNNFQTSARLNVWQPEFYFLTLLEESLQKQGIKFNGIKEIQAAPEETIQAFKFERGFDSVIVNLNKVSDNLSAEMTLRAIGEKYFGKPSSAKKGLKLIDSLIVLSGLNPDDYRLVDGSGVSHYNLVSAELLLSVLKFIYNNHPGLYKILYHSFPIAGVDGTLENRMINTSAQNNVHAKTGTLSGVASLSGYVTSKSGDQIVFSILMQNYVGSSRTARDVQDKICELLAEY
ncbi:MAG: D-alanyl-D-alanine carboxypeptidase/D-alanyl-D-alanine-endopeptidase [Ignavibacteriaceae bacterium]